MPANTISIKRTHGLGNIIMLLPILKTLISRDIHVTLYTKEDYLNIFNNITFKNRITVRRWSSLSQSNIDIDLDSATRNTKPSMHRVDQFYEICKVKNRYQVVHLDSAPPEHTDGIVSKNYLLVCPDAGHPSRIWDREKLISVCNIWRINGDVIVVGNNDNDEIIPNCIDLRGKTTVQDLISYIDSARLVLTMDSAVLHLAAALRKPVVALFGNINPWYRIRYYSKCIALCGNVPCFPCNKEEKCTGKRFACINSINVQHVCKALQMLENKNNNCLYATKCSGEETLQKYYH